MRSLENRTYIVYVGTYTSGSSEGIYGFKMELESGRLTSLGLMAKAENPSYFIMDTVKQHLYSVYESDEYQGTGGGAVGVYSLNQINGDLTKINEQGVKGKAPCHLCIDEKRQALFTANYNDGAISVFELNQDISIGSMTDYVQHEGHGTDQDRQEKAHAHFVTVAPNGTNLYAVDLGIDQVKVYSLQSNMTLIEEKDKTIQIEAGFGPRHLVFSSSGDTLYVVNELKPYVMVFHIDSKNVAVLIQTIKTIPIEYTKESYCAAIKMTLDGQFLYVTNRGHDSIAGYKIDQVSGKLELVSFTPTGGRWPRDLEIDPSGRWMFVANQESDDITAFQIQRDTGRLEPIGIVARVSKPVCIKIIEL